MGPSEGRVQWRGVIPEGYCLQNVVDMVRWSIEYQREERADLEENGNGSGSGRGKTNSTCSAYNAKGSVGLYTCGLFFFFFFFSSFCGKKARPLLKARLLFVRWSQREASGCVFTLWPWFPSRRWFTGTLSVVYFFIFFCLWTLRVCFCNFKFGNCVLLR